jgi:hypothetical protein
MQAAGMTRNHSGALFHDDPTRKQLSLPLHSARPPLDRNRAYGDTGLSSGESRAQQPMCSHRLLTFPDHLVVTCLLPAVRGQAPLSDSVGQVPHGYRGSGPQPGAGPTGPKLATLAPVGCARSRSYLGLTADSHDSDMPCAARYSRGGVP